MCVQTYTFMHAITVKGERKMNLRSGERYVTCLEEGNGKEKCNSIIISKGKQKN